MVTKDLAAVEARGVEGLADLGLVAVGGGRVDMAVAGLQSAGDGLVGVARRDLEDAEAQLRDRDVAAEVHVGKMPIGGDALFLLALPIQTLPKRPCPDVTNEAARSTVASSKCRPTSIIPTGSPSELAHGTLNAGLPVTSKGAVLCKVAQGRAEDRHEAAVRRDRHCLHRRGGEGEDVEALERGGVVA